MELDLELGLELDLELELELELVPALVNICNSINYRHSPSNRRNRRNRRNHPRTNRPVAGAPVRNLRDGICQMPASSGLVGPDRCPPSPSHLSLNHKHKLGRACGRSPNRMQGTSRPPTSDYHQPLHRSKAMYNKGDSARGCFVLSPISCGDVNSPLVAEEMRSNTNMTRISSIFLT